MKKFFIILSMLLLAGCGLDTDEPVATPIPTFTPEPSPVPTKPALGTEMNPIIVGIVHDPSDNELDEDLDSLARFLSQGAGAAIETRSFPNDTILVNQLRGGNVHIAFFHPLTYLYAHSEGLADAVMLLSHFGIFEYGTQILVNKGSGFFPYFDPDTQQNLGSIAEALAQLQARRPCWTSPGSISGYLLPRGILSANNISLQDEIFTQSYNASIRALYITGICDFGAAYAHSGDPRTSSTLQHELPDVMERVIVLWQSEPVIPYLNISFHHSIPAEIRRSLITSFLVLVQTQDGKDQLTRINNFQIDGGKIIDDTYYDPIRGYIDILDEDPDIIIGY